VSERHDPGLEKLSERLDAAFAATRPRRGFEDELWARLQRRPPWWRRLGRLTVATPWPALGAVATVLLAGFFLLVVPRPGGGATAQPVSQPYGRAQSATSGDRSGTVPALAPTAPVPAASVPDSGAAELVFAVPPLGVPVRLAVYRYALGANAPASGQVPAEAPASTTQIGSFATRSLEEAERRALPSPAAPGSGSTLTLTSVELVYVAVTAGAYGYLEPAYMFRGKLQSGGQTYERQVTLPALAQSAYR
jgi:hypothetical protein